VDKNRDAFQSVFIRTGSCIADSNRSHIARPDFREEKMRTSHLKLEKRVDKILTKHPEGKSGRSISKKKYKTMKQEILSILQNAEPTHTELFRGLNKNLQDRFEGDIGWYGETVKLDLEARKIIERTAAKPARYRLTGKVR